MKHTVIYKRDGWYTAFPQLDVLPDGRMVIGVNSSPFHDHFLIGEWKVLVSDDEGGTWSESDDPTIPHNWDASGVRERYDRYERWRRPALCTTGRASRCSRSIQRSGC